MSAPVARAGWEVPRLRHVWVLLTLVATFALPASSPIVFVDLAWTLQGGAWMVANRAFLDHNPFTAAPAAPVFVNAQWLAQLIYFGAYAIGGLPLVITFTALLGTLAYAAVLATSLLATGGWVRLACLATLIGFLLGVSNVSPRAQALAYPLFGLFLLVVGRAVYQGRRGALWLLPPATLVWANSHGSFFLGPLLLACAAVGAAWDARSWRVALPFVFTGLVSVAAASLTPYGPALWLYLALIAGNPAVRRLGEWGPPSLGSTEGVFFLGSLVLLALALAASRVRPRPYEWLLLLAFGGLALASVRSVVWWGFVLAPILAHLGTGVARRLSAAPSAPPRERPVLNLAIISLLILLSIASLPWFKAGNPLIPTGKQALVREDTPVAVTDFLKQEPAGGQMFNYADWGGYLAWELWPGQKPFLDTRAELYRSEVWADYAALSLAASDWREIAARYGFDTLVLHASGQARLVSAAQDSADWRQVYRDGQAVVFRRVAGSTESERPSS